MGYQRLQPSSLRWADWSEPVSTGRRARGTTRCGSPAESTLLVADRPDDVEAGRAAGGEDRGNEAEQDPGESHRDDRRDRRTVLDARDPRREPPEERVA